MVEALTTMVSGGSSAKLWYPPTFDMVNAALAEETIAKPTISLNEEVNTMFPAVVAGLASVYYS